MARRQPKQIIFGVTISANIDNVEVMPNPGEIINGTNSNDTLFGGSKNDTLIGGEGDDQLFGGDGRDTLEGNFGNDTLWGDSGFDQLIGGDGLDQLLGGSDGDFLEGGSGNDTLWGDSGFDQLIGGEGDDQLLGGDGFDTLEGDLGNDILWGDSGDDTLLGGDGNDYLDGFGGDAEEVDSLTGGLGSDTFVIGDSAGVDYQSGGRDDLEDFAFAIISDFSAAEDFIQASGSSSDYELDFSSDLLGNGNQDTGIYLGDDLIAVVENTTDVNFDRNFIFV